MVLGFERDGDGRRLNPLRATNDDLADVATRSRLARIHAQRKAITLRCSKILGAENVGSGRYAVLSPASLRAMRFGTSKVMCCGVTFSGSGGEALTVMSVMPVPRKPPIFIGSAGPADSSLTGVVSLAPAGGVGFVFGT